MEKVIGLPTWLRQEGIELYKYNIQVYEVRKKGFWKPRDLPTTTLEGIVVMDAEAEDCKISGVSVRFSGILGKLKLNAPEVIIYPLSERERFYENFNPDNLALALKVLVEAQKNGYLHAQTAVQNGKVINETLLAIPASVALPTQPQKELATKLAQIVAIRLDDLVAREKPFTEVRYQYGRRPSQHLGYGKNHKSVVYRNLGVMPKDSGVVPLNFKYVNPSFQRLWHYTMRPH